PCALVVFLAVGSPWLGCATLLGDNFDLNDDAAAGEEAAADQGAPVDSTLPPEGGVAETSTVDSRPAQTLPDVASPPPPCDPKKQRCSPAVCQPGQATCNASSLLVCNADQTGWDTKDTCATPVLCDAAGATCNPPVCSAGKYRCGGLFGAELQM